MISKVSVFNKLNLSFLFSRFLSAIIFLQFAFWFCVQFTTYPAHGFRSSFCERSVASSKVVRERLCELLKEDWIEIKDTIWSDLVRVWDKIVRPETYDLMPLPLGRRLLLLNLSLFPAENAVHIFDKDGDGVAGTALSEFGFLLSLVLLSTRIEFCSCELSNEILENLSGKALKTPFMWLVERAKENATRLSKDHCEVEWIGLGGGRPNFDAGDFSAVFEVPVVRNMYRDRAYADFMNSIGKGAARILQHEARSEAERREVIKELLCFLITIRFSELNTSFCGMLIDVECGDEILNLELIIRGQLGHIPSALVDHAVSLATPERQSRLYKLGMGEPFNPYAHKVRALTVFPSEKLLLWLLAEREGEEFSATEPTKKKK